MIPRPRGLIGDDLGTNRLAAFPNGEAVESHRLVSKPEYNGLDSRFRQVRVKSLRQQRPIGVRHRRKKVMLQVIKMLNGHDGGDNATKGSRLRDFVYAVRIVRKIGSYQWNDPTPHFHQRQIDQQYRRIRKDNHRKDHCHEASKAFTNDPSLVLTRVSQCPQPNAGLENESFRNCAEERPACGGRLNIVRTGIACMMMKMSRLIGMATADGKQFDQEKKPIIHLSGQAQTAMNKVMGRRAVGHKAQTYQRSYSQGPITQDSENEICHAPEERICNREQFLPRSYDQQIVSQFTKVWHGRSFVDHGDFSIITL